MFQANLNIWHVRNVNVLLNFVNINSNHLATVRISRAVLGRSSRKYTLHNSKYVLMIGCSFTLDKNCFSASRKSPKKQHMIMYDISHNSS